jgi:hypothetical protein
MSFPGSVLVAYSKSLSGVIIVAMEGALKAAPHYCGLRYENTNATYGEEMPDEIKATIEQDVEEQYAPLAIAALKAKEDGNENWRELREAAREALVSIANVAQAAWYAA